MYLFEVCRRFYTYMKIQIFIFPMYLHLFFLGNEKVLLMILFYYKSNFFYNPVGISIIVSYVLYKLFSFINTSGLNALKKNGDPENDNGETGP